MEEVECCHCGKVVLRHKSRNAKYCSSKCSEDHKRRTPIDLFREDTPEAMYWMGFIFGDGSVDDRGKLQVCLSQKDEDHLEKLSLFIFGEDVVNRYQDRCHLQASYKDLTGRLAKFGIVPRKTYASKMVLPDYYPMDFLRGFFDADGWYTEKEYLRPDGVPYVKRILGFCSYLEETLEVVKYHLGMKQKITKKKKQHLFELKSQGKKEIGQIREKMNGYPRLERKWLGV